MKIERIEAGERREVLDLQRVPLVIVSSKAHPLAVDVERSAWEIRETRAVAIGLLQACEVAEQLVRTNAAREVGAHDN
jgi:hypothetical protein